MTKIKIRTATVLFSGVAAVTFAQAPAAASAPVPVVLTKHAAIPVKETS